MSIDQIALEDRAEGSAPIPEQIAPAAVDRPSFQIPEWLKAPTGEGPVESYIDHPMNIKKNEHFARILRGLTGMFNSLDYAIIDVVVGILGFMKKPPTGTV